MRSFMLKDMLYLAGLSWDLVQAGSIERCWLLGLRAAFEAGRWRSALGSLLARPRRLQAAGCSVTSRTWQPWPTSAWLRGRWQWLHLDDDGGLPDDGREDPGPQQALQCWSPGPCSPPAYPRWQEKEGEEAIPCWGGRKGLEAALRWLGPRTPERMRPLKLVQLHALIQHSPEAGGIGPCAHGS